MIHEIKQIFKKFYYPITSIPLYCKEFGHTFFLNKLSKQKKLESMILVTVHSLEKGMGIKNTRKGYGQTKARKALSYMEEYVSKGFSDSSFAFLEGVKMLEAYIDYNNNMGIACYVPAIQNLFARSLSVIPLQLRNYYVSIGKGFDVDKPRNLAKSVTVE